MVVYEGVVEGNVVVLPADVHLADGQRVEVRPVPSATTDVESPEDLLNQRLLESGLITEIRKPTPLLEEEDYTPIQVKGKPLSEMIIEERR